MTRKTGRPTTPGSDPKPTVCQKAAAKASLTPPGPEGFGARALLDTVETLIVALDVEGRVTVANRKACQVLGWAEHELIGQFWFSLCLPQPEGMERMLPAFRKIVAGDLRAAEYFENPVLTRSGEVRQIDWHNALLYDDRGRIIGTLSSGHDATDIRAAEAAAHASQQILAGILDAVPVSVFWKDRNLVFLGCNQAFARELGLAHPTDIVGKDDYQLVSREHAEQYRRDDRRVMESGCARILVEEPLNASDGRTLTLLTSKVPLRNPDGEIWGVLGTFVDISDRKQADDRIRLLTKQLLDLREAERTRVSAVLHHDVGSLVVGMTAFLDCIENGLRAGRPDEALPMVRNARKLLHQTTARFVDLAIELRPTELDALGLGTALRQYLATLSQNVGIPISFTETLGGVRVPADITTTLFRMAQEAVTDAVVNRQAASVEVDLTSSGEFFTLIVHDDGRILDSSGLDARGPAQLSLFVTQEMAALSRGTIAIDSTPEQGTTLRVSLPRETAATQTAVPPAQSPRPV